MSDRVAVVTGASRGIGRSVAEHLAGKGYRVALNYARSSAGAEELVHKILASGGDAIAVQADVGEEDQVISMFDTVRDRLGPIEILVNNAGITRDGLLVRMSAADWDEVIRVDLRSVFLCTRAVLRDMIRAHWGRIISISSVAGVVGNAGQANYAAAKAAIIGFSKAIAKEVGSRHITSNVVAPGFIETDLTAGLGDGVVKAALGAITLSRFGTAEEVASVVGYLASDEAAYITGQVIRVDGGLAL